MDPSAPPPPPPLLPVTLTDLPAELLVLVFTAVFEAAAPPPSGVAVPFPAATDDLPPAPMVGAAGWAAAAGAAAACRALRDAFCTAVTAVEVDPAARGAVTRVFGAAYDSGVVGSSYAALKDALDARKAGRVGGLGGLVRRLHSLRSLQLRLDRLATAADAAAAMAAVVDALAAPGGPSLVALTILVHPDVPLPAGLVGLAAVQPRLQHLAAAVAWLNSLPVLPAVRFVRVHFPATASVLAATARACPAGTTLCLSELPIELDNDEGAAAVVRLFPHLDRLAVFNPDGAFPAVSATFVSGVVRRRALHTLALYALETPDGEQGESLVDALYDACVLPSRLHYWSEISSEEVLDLTVDGLPGVECLQLTCSMDMDAAVALGRCASLRSLYVSRLADESHVNEALAAVLVPPTLTHLTLTDVDFGPAAAGALVMAARRATPPALRSLTLSNCTGDVSTLIDAAEGLPTLRRMVFTNYHRSPLLVAASRGMWEDQLALLEDPRPYALFVTSSYGDWQRGPDG
ncbi:hypothetical protein I4F81_002350 [Pyropia yezoensis]|uniref:Uncharacterized protein n=1 Tax=Pyropia yezoensis TaxID=2788 RepID=A0ACC3BP62_PYRYE|nr:hypothetical protein I4F81_002350 [Neopyropia yezoensis]